MEDSTTNNNNSEELYAKGVGDNIQDQQILNETLEDLEDKEIDQILNKFYSTNISKQEQNIVTNTKNFDWLSFLFTNNDLKNMYLHQDHIREILIYEAIYYLNIFSNVYNDRIREKPVARKSGTTLPLIRDTKVINTTSVKQNTVNTNTFDNSTNVFSTTIIKIGIIGCGNIGSELLKKFVDIKDNKVFSYKIYVSTRRPDKITADILNRLDEDIEIFLDNEKVFRECDIIYLCIQPHQIDLLSKEIYNVLQERIERLNKKKHKIYPMIVSFLSATPLARLKMFFPEKVYLYRTCLINKFLKTTKIDLKNAGYEESAQRNYIKESSEHLLGKNSIDFINSFIYDITEMVNTIAIKDKENPEKRIIQEITEIPSNVISYIIGDSLTEKYHSQYDIKTKKFLCEDKTELIKASNEYYIKAVNELLKLI